MNDRYLYRAKRKKDGEWVEGYYLYCTIKDNNKSELENFIYKHWIVKHNGILYDVDTSTICQCTGLKDKNGKIAFEHDIIKTPVGNAKIEWNCSPSPTDNHINVGFEIVFLDSTANDNYRHDLGYWIGKSEVIGSTIDNPELLEA